MTAEAAKIPLRERQRGLTRRLIIDALARALVDTGIHQFSMQEVADGAGVSLRTLYRHFPTREDLLEGLGEEVDDFVREALGPVSEIVGSVEEIASWLGEGFRTFERRPDLVRAWVITSMAAGFSNKQRRERERALRAAVQAYVPHLSDREQLKVYGVLRCLIGSLAWKVMTDDVGLDTREAGEAVEWAIRALLSDLVDGERPTERE